MIACYILHSTLPNNFMLALLTKVQEPGYLMHNNATYGNHFTSRVNDWEIRLIIPCFTGSQSMKIEKHKKKEE